MDDHGIGFMAGEVFEAGANVASGVDAMATGAVNFKDGMAAIALAVEGEDALEIGVGVAEEVKSRTQEGDRHEQNQNQAQLWGKVRWGRGGVGHGKQLNGETAGTSTGLSLIVQSMGSDHAAFLGMEVPLEMIRIVTNKEFTAFRCYLLFVIIHAVL